jgi:6,7-dimethyl-8-ribityllumazine synthase
MIEPRRAKREDVAPDRYARILIVESDYYEDIAAMLRLGATRVLEAASAHYEVMTVLGALEIPQGVAIALDLASSTQIFDGVVALGCVIRGETSHYDIVAGESARALMDIGITRKIPVGNGILTVDTIAQARSRAAPEQGDKGGSAARAALGLIRLRRQLAMARKLR